MIENILDFLQSLIGTALSVILVIIAYLVVRRLFSSQSTNGKGTAFNRQVALILVILIGGLLIVFSLPIENELKGQIISLVGIVLSATFALSSTTLLGNALAGIMNRTINHFKTGDFVTVGDHFGRITSRGLFHTEIQNADRSLTTLPNLFLASNPVNVIRASGTILSCEVSLGYDIPKAKIENALKEAAINAGLSDPYVYVTKLGDFSVSYKIHGFLQNSDLILTSNSTLKSKILDALHDNEIEIVSPTFMNQRQVGEKTFIPKKEVIEETVTTEKSPEEIIFDKAMHAETIEKKKEFITKLENYIESLELKLKEAQFPEEKVRLEGEIERWKEKLKISIDSLEEPQ